MSGYAALTRPTAITPSRRPRALVRCGPASPTS